MTVQRDFSSEKGNMMKRRNKDKSQLSCLHCRCRKNAQNDRDQTRQRSSATRCRSSRCGATANSHIQRTRCAATRGMQRRMRHRLLCSDSCEALRNHLICEYADNLDGYPAYRPSKAVPRQLQQTNSCICHIKPHHGRVEEKTVSTLEPLLESKRQRIESFCRRSSEAQSSKTWRHVSASRLCDNGAIASRAMCGPLNY
jgi:hypothetical protein